MDMKKLTIKLKLTYYTVLTYWEDFVNKLSGGKSDLGVNRPLAKQSREHQNQKLARGIKKLTARLYGADGKLQRWAKRKDINIFNTIPKYKKTPMERLEEVRIIDKTLRTPTDESNTIESMVNHNVSNAPRYVLERERRVLSKEKFAAIKDNDSLKARILDNEIKTLNKQISRLK